MINDIYLQHFGIKVLYHIYIYTDVKNIVKSTLLFKCHISFSLK